MIIEARYCDGTYLAENPDWDRKDAVWKAEKVRSMLSDNGIEPTSICEVGCGSGDVLAHLQKAMLFTNFTGFDISPQAKPFWEEHDVGERLRFQLGDFHETNRITYDVLLMLDVFEHVRDPFSFLENTRRYAAHFIFHIPLDLSASAVARGNPLMNVRKKAGHLHHYTKDLALATLRETGYEVIDWRYTGASLNSPNRSVKTRFAALPRRLAYAVNKDLGVRLLGGETLLVLAKPALCLKV
jgi:SAM-dependent methyltransferase